MDDFVSFQDESLVSSKHGSIMWVPKGYSVDARPGALSSMHLVFLFSEIRNETQFTCKVQGLDP